MDEAKRTIVQAWLIKAQRDLASAQRLSVGDNPLLDTAAYHCQQAAEKALKGFLVFRDVRVRKTHDLEELIMETTALTPDYAMLTGAAKRIYATEFRYPGMRIEPMQAGNEQAYQNATQFVGITLALIPAEAHPAA